MIAGWNRVEIAERVTAGQFFELAPEQEKAELIDGILTMAPPPLDIHERLQGFLYTLIRSFAEMHDLGEVRGSRTAVQLAEDQVFEPDILFVRRERSALIQERGVMGAPDLVVEILSASTAAYDRGPKLRAYERAGVWDVWLIDPYGPAGTHYYQRQGERLHAVAPDAQGWLTALALPGFRLQVMWLWPDGRFIPVPAALRQMA